MRTCRRKDASPHRPACPQDLSGHCVICDAAPQVATDWDGLIQDLEAAIEENNARSAPYDAAAFLENEGLKKAIFIARRRKYSRYSSSRDSSTGRLESSGVSSESLDVADHIADPSKMVASEMSLFSERDEETRGNYWKAKAFEYMDQIVKAQAIIDQMTILRMQGKCGNPAQVSCKPDAAAALSKAILEAHAKWMDEYQGAGHG